MERDMNRHNDSHTGPTGSTRSGTAQILPFRQRVTPSSETARGHEADDQIASLAELLQAIYSGRVVNHYQPQYELTTGRIVAVEALVRLLDSDGALVYPDRFIAEAEKSGLIAPLGRSVIHTACRDLARWRAEGLDIRRVSINLSSHQVNIDHELPGYICATAVSAGLSPSDLEFEITERQALLPEGLGVRSLRTLSSVGSRLAIDDFGIGYSSVAYLTTLPIDTIKLDRSMINRLPGDRTTRQLVKHLLGMAADLDLLTVAEGIESEAQGSVLESLGCQLGQGFLVAKPMHAEAVSQFMRSRMAPSG